MPEEAAVTTTQKQRISQAVAKVRLDLTVRFLLAGQAGLWFSIHDEDGKVVASCDWPKPAIVATWSDTEVRTSLVADLACSGVGDFRDFAAGESGGTVE